MNKLIIGDVIFRLRKEKGITQDQLGSFIGVSTAAVSKWESGASYPDITLLPVLATFFNVSMDTLLNFKIDLTEDEVMKLFTECEKLFSRGELEKGEERAKEYISKYPNSFYLKLRMAFLYLMYSWKFTEVDKANDIISETIRLFEDVADNCCSDDLVEQALFQLGALYPTIGEQDKAVEALNKIRKSQLDPELIMANIYIDKGDIKKAREILQSHLFKNLHYMGMVCIGLANSHMKESADLSMVEKYYNLSININKMFSDDNGAGIGLSTEYLSLAQTYLKLDELEKAMDILDKMAEDMKVNDINNPRSYKKIWCFNEIPEGKQTITMNLYENMFKILESAEFDKIREDMRFKKFIIGLKALDKRKG
ncbi:MAG: helix-turn-helix domain-containing protein [Solirubrobacterales bacterium]